MNLRNKALTVFDIAKTKLCGIRKPVFLNWALTYRCNQKCLYCQWPSVNKEELSTADALAIIDKLRILKVRRINLTGGEPLVREDIFDLVDVIKKAEMFICLNTNGFLVAGNIKYLKNIDMINLSFEGDKEIHDAVRGKGAFEALIRAQEAARKEGIKIKFTSTINKFNFPKVESMVKTAYKLGVKITFQFVEDFTLGIMGENPIKLSRHEIKQAAEAIIHFKKQPKYRTTITNSLTALNCILQGFDMNDLECASGKIAFRITPQGKLFPCAGATFRQLEVSCFTVDLRLMSVDQIKKSINSFDYSKIKCACNCSNRLSLNLLWNLRPQQLNEMLEI